MQRYTVLSMGEPAGTSPEIITRTLRGLVRDPEAAVIVTGDDGIFRRLASDIDLPLPFTFYAESHDELSKAEEAQKTREKLVPMKRCTAQLT